MKRLTYIDQLKGFGILAVLFLHTVGYIRNALPYTDVPLWRLEAWLHSFLMPFFVFVSGFSFYHFYLKPKTRNNTYIYIYIFRLLQIYAVFGSSIVISKILFSSYTVDKVDPSHFLSNFLLPDTSMWYIWFLTLMTIATLILHRLQLTEPVSLICIGLFTLFATLFGGPLNISNLPIGLQHLTSLPLFYFLGIYFAKKEIHKKMVKQTVFHSLAGLVTVFYLIYLQSYQTYPNQHLAFHTFLRYANGLAMTYLIVSIIITLESRLPAIIAWFGQYSLYFYLIHTYILTILTLFIKKYFLDFPIPVLLPMSFGLLLIINTLALFIVKKIPILDKLFQGKLVSYPQKKYE